MGVTLLAVLAWRFATHAPGLLLHPVRLLAAALGWRALGTALTLSLLQAAAAAAFAQARFTRDTQATHCRGHQAAFVGIGMHDACSWPRCD